MRWALASLLSCCVLSCGYEGRGPFDDTGAGPIYGSSSGGGTVVQNPNVPNGNGNNTAVPKTDAGLSVINFPDGGFVF